MLTFLLAHENWPFAFAFAFVIALGIFEILAMLLGLSLLSTIDDILPTEIDADIDSSGAASGITGLLGWLCLGRLPLLIWLVLTLTTFSILGFIGSYLSIYVFEHYQPIWMVTSLAAGITIISIHYTGNWLANLLPKNETSAINRDDLAGSVGNITLGIATHETPAEAVIKDAFLQKHYVRVIPDSPRDTFTQGTSIILLRRQDNLWLAARYQQ
ncbi:hypothetical protein SOPP22_04680 [Shewanella sp. OPT22]|nr:hypothetical protein SOPP22_04680 [Shewanella sp. OPT22]